MKDFNDFLNEQTEKNTYNLDPEALTDEEKLFNRCKERSLYLIEQSEKTEGKLRELLKRSGKYPDDVIDRVVVFLKEYGYLDDLRYARQLIKYYKGQKSAKEIEQKLYTSKVDRNAIKTAMEEFKEDSDDADSSELEAVQALIQKKYGTVDPDALEPDAKRKMYASLMRKGFSYEMIKKALEIEDVE